MIGPIDGLELRNGFNPFGPGKLASTAIARLVAVDQAKTREEYRAALKAVDEFEQTQPLSALRTQFLQAAHAAGGLGAQAAQVFGRLEEVVSELLQLARALPTIHTNNLDPELAFRVDGLVGWERWCISSVMNQGKVVTAMRSMHEAINATDRIAVQILHSEGTAEGGGH